MKNVEEKLCTAMFVKRTSYWVMDELATFLEACQL